MIIFKRKGINEFSGLTFCWSNFIVDKRNEYDFGAGYKDKKVKCAADYDNLINPAEPNPERYFSHLVNGKIKPADGLNEEDREKAEYTIETFNLNHPTLLSCRATAINLVRSYRQSGFTDAEILQNMANEGFPTTIGYAIGLGNSIVIEVGS